VRGLGRSLVSIPDLLIEEVLVAKGEFNFPFSRAIRVPYDRHSKPYDCLCIRHLDSEMTEVIETLRVQSLTELDKLFVPLTVPDLSCKRVSGTVLQNRQDLRSVQKETRLHSAHIKHMP
jgi:hypothetical protein